MKPIQSPILSPPVQGVWRIVNSPGHAPFAFDLAAVHPGTGSTLRASRLKHILGQVTVQDSYSWGKQVRSPISGIVRCVNNDVPDRVSLSLVRDLVRMLTARPDLSTDRIQAFAGNSVLIEADGSFVFAAHLRCGSILVMEGDNVETGQFLGEVGNSGFTLEPHLHLQLFDQIDNLLTASAPPFFLEAFEVKVDGNWVAVSQSILPKGKIVRFA
jgi:hypothetical protein